MTDIQREWLKQLMALDPKDPEQREKREAPKALTFCARYSSGPRKLKHDWHKEVP